MEAGERLSLEQIRAFLEASEAVGFEAANRKELYVWVNRALREQGYDRLGRPSRGLVRRYVAKMTGLSRAQVTRLIGRYLDGEEVRVRDYRRHRFANRYRPADSELLAGVDEAHGGLSGPATQKIMPREIYEVGGVRSQRLAAIFMAPQYNLPRWAISRRRC